MARKHFLRAALLVAVATIAPAMIAWAACVLPGSPPFVPSGKRLPSDWASFKAYLSHSTSEYWYSAPRTGYNTQEQDGGAERKFRGDSLFSAGWPMRCFYSGRRIFDDETYQDWGQLVLNKQLAASRPFDHTLPIVPSIPAYSINAALYGTASWVLLYGPGVLSAIQHRRRERMVGHCGVCGYNLAGIQSGTCPECGHEQAVILRESRLIPREP